MAVGWGEERLQRAFVTAADDRISSLNTRMGFKLQQLNSLAVFFESSQYVSPEEFSHFVSHLSEDNEAGFAYAWIPHVRDDERESFEGSLNSSGKTALEIRDKKNKTMVRAASRSDYFPIQYLQPEQKSWMTIGYDLATNVDMQEALNTARISLSPRASLAGAMQDRSGETGIVMFVPVFHGMVTQANQHQKLQGFVAGVFSPDAVLAKSISDFEPAGLDLDLFDISTESAPKHLATYTAITRNAQNSSMRDHQTLLSQVLSYSRKIEVAGKTWEVIASPAPAFFEGQKNLLPIFILGFGLLLTGSLCLLLYSTVQNAHRQRQFANAAIAAKEALECSEKMLSDAQAMAKLGNWNWDIQSNELQWSDEIYRIFGLQPQQFGASYEAFLNSVHPDDREMVNHATSAAVEHGTHYAIDHRIVLADGSERFVHEEGGAIFEDGKAVRMMGTVQDITEQRGLEDQLRHAQKMEAIGTLVGGIAHDFNNTLAAIQGNVYLARRAAQGNAVVLDKLTAVEKMGGRAADMIKKLLTFARKDTVSIATFSMNELVEETVMLARRGFAEDVEIRCEVSDQNLPVAGDISLLEQVILNLLNNAYDAVSQVESPLISCSLQPSRADEFLRIRHPELEGDVFALLVIRDNGYGIPEKYLKNIFEPFFTTKEVGKGTGLGLSMAYGAIHNHGGVIEVSSKQGEGCEFKIYLPICSEAGVPQGDELIDDVAKGEGETILLVDDHHDMRSSSAEVLSELGYQVIEAVDGEQAVELFNANRERLDIIISDVVMPKMSGIDAVRHIRALGGDLPVVFVSGYSEEKTGLVDGSVANSRLLAKPYDVGELSQLLRRLIEAEKT
ncbi:CHASE domain-containing protein [Mariprofundus sp. KV]|uniref:CHASE domain-containing protein n=1 Tax=Mariprofundus sp. KV TaxID=2608715 RepID=UPI0015A1F9B4|nr:CHASE domain-containing protein [Mariprofundus sp. KV]